MAITYNKLLVKYGSAIAIVLSMASLMIPVFINGYPLLNPDITSYLHSGFTLTTPPDRPLMYGIILRIFSLNGITLWGPIIIQAFTISWLTMRIIRHITGSANYAAYTFITLLLLSVTTSLSWVVSELLPDVFTPIAILCIIVILLGKEKGFHLFLIYFIFFIAIATHLSHILIFTATLICVYLLKSILFIKSEKNSKLYPMLIFFAICLCCVPLMQKPTHTSGHAFIMASLNEKGVLKKYLDASCEEKKYTICKYKDSMSTDPNSFLWDDFSPMNKEGGWWNAGEEYRAIIKDIFLHYPYNCYFLYKSSLFTIDQLHTIGIGDGLFVFIDNTIQYYAVKEHVPGEAWIFLQSRQNTGRIYQYLTIPNLIIQTIVVLCLIGLIIYRKVIKQHYGLRIALVTCLLGILINAFDCAAFAQVNGRYGCRVTWLIPLCFILTWLVRRNNRAQQPS